MTNKIIKAFISSINNKANIFFRSPSPLYLGAIIYIVPTITFLMSIPPNDYWWYLRLGQDILQNHSIPVVDSYTYTQTGKPYIFNAWLSSVLFWLLRDTTLATLLHGTLPLMFCGLIWKCCRIVGARTKLTMILTLIMTLVAVSQCAMRPQLFSFPLFALALLSILQWRQGKTRWVWFLPGIALLWVNLHGAFPLLFLLAGAALVGGEGERKTLAFALFASFLATLVNPHGIITWYYVYTVLIDTATQQLGPEWLPPTIAQYWNYKILFLWLLVFPVITALSSRKLKLTDWLWFFGFGWMALSGQRYVIWFVAIFAPINAMLLTPLANRSIDRRVTLGKPIVNIIVFFILVFSPLAYMPGVRIHWQPKPPLAYTSNTPVAAVDWLKSHPELSGNLWADLAMSVYVIYALPERLVWIDTRTNLFPLEQWQDYLAIVSAIYYWEKLLDRDNVKLLLLDPKQQALLIQALKESPNWYSPYQDEHSIIFTLIPK